MSLWRGPRDSCSAIHSTDCLDHVPFFFFSKKKKIKWLMTESPHTRPHPASTTSGSMRPAACGCGCPLATGCYSARTRTSTGTSLVEGSHAVYGERHRVRLVLPVTLMLEWLWRVLCSSWSFSPNGTLSSRWCWLSLCRRHTSVYGGFLVKVHYFLFVLVSGSHFLCVWLLLVEYRVWIRLEMPLCYSSCAMPGSTVDTCSVSAPRGFRTNCPHFLRRRGLGS